MCINIEISLKEDIRAETKQLINLFNYKLLFHFQKPVEEQGKSVGQTQDTLGTDEW